MRKSRLIIIITIISILLLVTISKDVVASFLLASGIKEDDATIGEVKVVARLFYELDGDIYPGQEYIASENKKPGVYYVNLSDSGTLEYIDNVYVQVYVYSNVDTYVRAKIVEELTVVRDTSFGKKEYSIPFNNPITYNIDNDWYLYNDYYYYPEKVKGNSNPFVIDFIIPGETLIDEYDSSHFLQLAIALEGVQATLGPQNNWGLSEAPWGGEW